MATARTIDVLVVAGLDRLARSLCHVVQLVETLEVHGVALVAVREGWDGTLPSTKFFASLLKALRQFELDVRKSARAKPRRKKTA